MPARAEIKRYAYGNVCQALADLGGYEDTGVLLNMTECQLYHNGLAQSGVAGLISDAIIHARRMISRRAQA